MNVKPEVILQENGEPIIRIDIPWDAYKPMLGQIKALDAVFSQPSLSLNAQQMEAPKSNFRELTDKLKPAKG